MARIHKFGSTKFPLSIWGLMPKVIQLLLWRRGILLTRISVFQEAAESDFITEFDALINRTYIITKAISITMHKFFTSDCGN